MPRKHKSRTLRLYPIVSNAWPSAVYSEALR